MLDATTRTTTATVMDDGGVGLSCEVSRRSATDEVGWTEEKRRKRSEGEGEREVVCFVEGGGLRKRREFWGRVTQRKDDPSRRDYGAPR